MPWRVGRDLRQLSQAAHRVLGRFRSPHLPLCVIAQPIHFTRRVLWPPAVAPKHNHSHAPTAKNASHLVENQLRPDAEDPSRQVRFRTGGLKDRAGGSDVVPLAPPPEVLSALNDLFAQHPFRCTMGHLRHSQVSYVVPFLRHPGVVLHFLESNGPTFTMWILRLAADVGQVFPAVFYGQLAGIYANMKRWRDVLRLVRLAKRSLGHFTTTLLNWRLHATMEIPRSIPVEDALAMFEKEGAKPSRLTYHLLASMHLRNRDLPSALAALNAMESAGLPVTTRTCAIVTLNYRSFGLTPPIKAQALDALNTTSNAQVATAILNGLIQLMLDAGDMHGVVTILSSLMQVPEGLSSGLGEDSIPEGGEAAEMADPARVPLTTLCHRNDIVNVTTYNILLEHLADQGDLSRTILLLQEMRAANMRPSSRTAATLTRLYFATGHTNDALHVVASTLVAFPAAVSVLPRLGFTPFIPPEQPIPPPTPPTIELFNSLLLGTLKDYGLKALHAVLSMMRIAEVEADSTTVTILLSHKHRRKLARPRELIRIVRVLMSSGVTPTIQHLHVVLGALLRQERETSHARGWHVGPSATPEVSDSIARESVGNVYSDHIADITFPIRRKHRNLLRPIVQSLTDRGVKNDRVTFGMLIKHEGVVRQDMEAAMQAFRTMVHLGIQPNIYHYAALMEGYARAGEMEAAESTLHTAMKAELPPNVKIYTILIFGYARFARPTMAVKTFRNMVAQGIRPDVPAIDALVSAFFRARAYKTARRVLLRLWPQIAPLEDTHLTASLRELAVAFRELHVANEGVPEALTSEERHALRSAIREIVATWKDVTTKGMKRRRFARDVMTRSPKYTKALWG